MAGVGGAEVLVGVKLGRAGVGAFDVRDSAAVGIAWECEMGVGPGKVDEEEGKYDGETGPLDGNLGDTQDGGETGKAGDFMTAGQVATGTGQHEDIEQRTGAGGSAQKNEVRG